MVNDFQKALNGAISCAKQYNEVVVVVESDVFHDHEYKYNWMVEKMRSTIYPDTHKEYWKIAAIINPNGTVIAFREDSSNVT